MASAPNLTLFLKPILSDSLRLRDKLMIPPEFVKKYGGDALPDTAFLKLPNGAEWEVNLEKRDGDQVWFVKGWKEFSEYYSLYDGRLLIFGYDHPTSRFHVLIFDLVTSLEIQYPSIGNTRSEASFEKGSSCTNDESVLPCLQQCKRKRVIDEERGQEVDLHHSTKKFKGQSREANTEEQSKTRVEIKTEITCSDNEAFEISETLQFPPRNPIFLESKISEGAAFDNFNSQNPFFQITIGKSHSQRLPVWFVKKYLKVVGEHIAELMVDEEKFWSVKLIHHSGKPLYYCYFSRGWKAFVRQNNLQVGDACSFEWINNGRDEKMIMRVCISKHSSVESSSLMN